MEAVRENLIRAENMTRLRRTLRALGSATKPALAQKTGLSVVTVGTLMNAMVESGEAELTRDNEMNGGRPAAIYRYNADHLRTLSAAVRHEGGRELAQLEVRDALGCTLWRRETRVDVDGVAFLDELIGEAMAVCEDVRAIAVGLCGEELGGTMAVSDYRALNGHSVSGHLRRRFGVPAIVENDAKTALTGYCARCPECRGQTVAALYMPADHLPGAAIWAGGRVLHGRNGMSGELAHMPLGIDWARPDKDEAFWRDVLSKLMLCLLATVNPHRVVVYGEMASDAAIAAAREYVSAPAGGALLPDEICRGDYARDMMEGAAKLAWHLAAPELEE